MEGSTSSMELKPSKQASELRVAMGKWDLASISDPTATTIESVSSSSIKLTVRLFREIWEFIIVILLFLVDN